MHHSSLKRVPSSEVDSGFGSSRAKTLDDGVLPLLPNWYVVLARRTLRCDDPVRNLWHEEVVFSSLEKAIETARSAAKRLEIEPSPADEDDSEERVSRNLFECKVLCARTGATVFDLEHEGKEVDDNEEQDDDDDDDEEEAGAEDTARIVCFLWCLQHLPGPRLVKDLLKLIAKLVRDKRVRPKRKFRFPFSLSLQHRKICFLAAGAEVCLRCSSRIFFASQRSSQPTIII